MTAPTIPAHPVRVLLIANRGEVARRIARSARAMGLVTVAVHTAEEAGEPFAVEADRAVLLDGDGAAAYLDIGAIVAAAHAAGADAVHPGYGFLSERADAARAVLDAGLTWVGPHPEAIAVMGDKLASKDAAARAGLPLLPSTPVDGDDPAAWRAALADAGLRYPVLLKAAAGGGGRGMRVVVDADSLDDAVVSARREADAAFGDGRVFAERWVARARHIEVQVVGDRHGQIVHLGERECTVQRRHQKVIEEAPSPMVDDTMRAELGAAACELCRAIGYDSLGTVELVVDDDTGEHFFLEMNTRLQVEHPVTEAVTGLDLVRIQLAVAGGEPLGITQDDVGFEGHAIEVRVTAEDPLAGWRPGSGRVHRWRPADDGARWDSAVTDGSTVSPRFDSLIAKAIVHAPSRTEAAHRLAASLRRLQCHGVTTSARLLAAVLEDEPFLAGRLHTGLLEERTRALAPVGPDDHLHLAAAVLARAHLARQRDPRWSRVPRGWRPGTHAAFVDHLRSGDDDIVSRLRVDDDGRTATFEAEWGHDGIVAATDLVVVSVSGDAAEVRVQVATTDGGPLVVHHLAVHVCADDLWVNDPLGQTTWQARSPFPDHAAAAGGSGPTAPVPGKVLAVLVEPGQRVEAGTDLVVLEAMKVEHRITAAAEAVVEAVLVTPGESVDAHQLLVRLGDAT